MVSKMHNYKVETLRHILAKLKQVYAVCHCILKIVWYIQTVSEWFFKKYRGADKSLVRPERKQDTAIEEFEFHVSYL